LLPPRPTSIANSAGCLLGDDFHGDLARPGIGLYGGHPRNQVADNPMAGAVSVEGRLVAVREVAAHTPVGYGGSYVAPVDKTLGVVGIGYADGLPRLLSNRGEACIAGRRVPIVGRLSMDLVHLDISALMALPKSPRVGDWVQFVGADIGVDEVAQWAGTIGLEILSGLGRRPTWEYVSD